MNRQDEIDRIVRLVHDMADDHVLQECLGKALDTAYHEGCAVGGGVPTGWKLVPVEPTRWAKRMRVMALASLPSSEPVLEAEWCAHCGCGNDTLDFAHLDSCPTLSRPEGK